MTDFRRYANFAKGTFYTCATVIMVGSAYIIYSQWQGYWAAGFKDFGSISEAIVQLEKTTQPISEVTPQIYAQMQEMNHSIAMMQGSVHKMDMAVNGINNSVRGMSYSVPQGMGALHGQMNPWKMMNPFN
jgi:TolA-binding protein